MQGGGVEQPAVWPVPGPQKAAFADVPRRSAEGEALRRGGGHGDQVLEQQFAVEPGLQEKVAAHRRNFVEQGTPQNRIGEKTLRIKFDEAVEIQHPPGQRHPEGVPEQCDVTALRRKRPAQRRRERQIECEVADPVEAYDQYPPPAVFCRGVFPAGTARLPEQFSCQRYPVFELHGQCLRMLTSRRRMRFQSGLA